MSEKIGVPENCEREGCAGNVATLIRTSPKDWAGLCLRHMTILVLVSTADSMEA